MTDPALILADSDAAHELEERFNREAQNLTYFLESNPVPPGWSAEQRRAAIQCLLRYEPYAIRVGGGGFNWNALCVKRALSRLGYGCNR